MAKRKLELVVAGLIIDESKRALLVKHKKLNKWLPPGGHIKENETPDDALHREIREEVGIEVELLNVVKIPERGNIKRQLAVPFYVNVHSVGDHDHCCFYYLCRPKGKSELKVNESEIEAARWFSMEEIEKSKEIGEDVKNLVALALEFIKRQQLPFP